MGVLRYRGWYSAPEEEISPEYEVEGRPPSARVLACVRRRVLVGVLKRNHPEPPHTTVEQFLAILRFEQRGKLAELSGKLEKGSLG